MLELNRYLKIQDGYRMFGTRWIKKFKGYPYRVQEIYIKDKIKNTWTNTPLDGMIATELHIGNTIYCLSFPDDRVTEFWQSDDYEARIGEQPVRVLRRIQMKVKKGWLTLEVKPDNSQYKVYISQEKI